MYDIQGQFQPLEEEENSHLSSLREKELGGMINSCINGICSVVLQDKTVLDTTGVLPLMENVFTY